MPTLNLQVSSNANDGGGYAGNSFSAGTGTRQFGFYLGLYDAYLWDRFTGLTGIAGATIVSAQISYLAGLAGSATLKSAVEDADNPTMPTTDADCSSRTLTAAVSAGTVSPTTESWFGWDIASAVQTVVNRPGFAGDALSVRSGNDGGSSAIVTYRRESDTTKAAKLDITYTTDPAPTVSSVSANSGPTAGGTNVTITGTGFTATPTVTFGGTSATNVAFVNSTTITCTTPAHAAGAVNVVVTNPDTQTGTGTNAFTYETPAVTVSSVAGINLGLGL